MHFSATVQVALPGDVVLRQPTFWERLSSLLRPPNLSTEERELRCEVLSIAEGMCTALRDSEVSDAVYLGIDGRTAYHDRVGIPNDLPLLLEAARTNRLQGPFGELRAVFTHFGDGLETLFELTVTRRFRHDTAAAVLAISSRLSALRPAEKEPLALARERLRSIVGDAAITGQFQSQFVELCQRLESALRRQFPDATVTATAPSTFVVRPARKDVMSLSLNSLDQRRPVLRAEPRCYHRATAQRYYDPWDCYYDDRAEIWIDLMLLDECLVAKLPSLDSLAIDIVDAAGVRLCGFDSVSSHLAEFIGVHDAASSDYSLGGLLLSPDYGWEGPVEPGASLDFAAGLSAGASPSLGSSDGGFDLDFGSHGSHASDHLVDIDLSQGHSDLLHSAGRAVADVVSSAVDALPDLGDIGFDD